MLMTRAQQMKNQILLMVVTKMMMKPLVNKTVAKKPTLRYTLRSTSTKKAIDPTLTSTRQKGSTDPIEKSRRRKEKAKLVEKRYKTLPQSRESYKEKDLTLKKVKKGDPVHPSQSVPVDNDDEGIYSDNDERDSEYASSDDASKLRDSSIDSEDDIFSTPKVADRQRKATNVYFNPAREVGLCNWEIYASFEKRDNSFKVKTYYPKHTCFRNPNNKMMTYEMVAKYFKSRIYAIPFIKCKDMMLFAYNELRGICKGILLSTVGRDGNNQMNPIAWVVVKSENNDSWKWFMEKLTHDLELSDGQGYTMISDRHPGIINAKAEVLALIVHKCCARHLYCNLARRNKGDDIKLAFWLAGKATNEFNYLDKMDALRALSKEAYAKLLGNF
ncbi:hypothetical protein SLEP1_g3453 [Rubroshorea leprosula]|uniref:MULE transposase domain-containing protein n=1 Tax=Rubroshorea leprosula TaxID=152421 RepID=A0AAV5HL05_9ROSI|nr:hypothetical protein SLEP1_g3453 [Rubroshorea leprosula]